MKLAIERNNTKIEIEASNEAEFDCIIDSIEHVLEHVEEKSMDINSVLSEATSIPTILPELSIDTDVPNYCIECGNLIEDCLCTTESTSRVVDSIISTSEIINLLQSDVVDTTNATVTLSQPEMSTSCLLSDMDIVSTESSPVQTSNLNIEAILSQEITADSVLGEPATPQSVSTQDVGVSGLSISDVGVASIPNIYGL